MDKLTDKEIVQKLIDRIFNIESEAYLFLSGEIDGEEFKRRLLSYIRRWGLKRFDDAKNS